MQGVEEGRDNVSRSGVSRSRVKKLNDTLYPVSRLGWMVTCIDIHAVILRLCPMVSHY